MSKWVRDLLELAARNGPAVLVTVAGVRGSAPRETGAKMLVTATETIGTIGGGQLEYEAARIACDLLRTDVHSTLQRFPLGPSMGQCCGGAVELLFEPVVGTQPEWFRDLETLYGQREPAVLCTRLDGAQDKFVVARSDHAASGSVPAAVLEAARDATADGGSARRVDDWLLEPVVSSDLNVAIFGAGHVGAALVHTLAAVDCNIRWVDSRRDVFPAVPPNVSVIETAEPAAEVAAMPPGSFYLVMTHSHPLDFDICTQVLARGDAAYCGLIGSRTKRRRFEKRFLEAGIAPDAIGELVCPIGVEGIDSKTPAAIAIAVAAEVLQVHERSRAVAADTWPANVRALHDEV